MKAIIPSLISLLLAQSAAPLSAVTFADIEFWAGTGSNRAALVVDWNSGGSPQSLVWGFRWDGTATGRTMMDAIEAADPRFVEFEGFGGGTVYGIGYDLDGDGGSFVSNPPSDTGFATDPDDHYQEGWLNAGFWSYWLSSDGANWGFSGQGLASRQLSDGSWDGWSWAPGFSSSAPSTPVPAAIPEPAILGIFAVGFVIAILARRHRG